jgi:hypothetical protein
MPAILFTLLQWVIVSTLARVFAGITLAVVAQTFLTDYALDTLATAVSTLNGMPSAVGQIMLLTGLGQCITVLGTALITRVVIVTSAKAFGIGLS